MKTNAKSYHGYRFPPEIISHGVWLYHRFALSFRDVEELTNNYAGGRSLKACLGRLQGSARDIADTHLHQAIRRTESLPTRTQVNFSNDLDMLLAELIRTLEDGGRSSAS